MITEKVVQEAIDQPKNVAEIRLGLKGSVLTKLAVESGFKRWPCSWKTIKRKPDLRSAKLVAKILEVQKKESEVQKKESEVHQEDSRVKSSVLPTIESPTLKSKAPPIHKSRVLPVLKSKAALFTRIHLYSISIKNLISNEDYIGPPMEWPIQSDLVQSSSNFKQRSVEKQKITFKP